MVGLAPFFLDRGTGGLASYRLLGAGTAAPLGPLSAPGKENEVASGVARWLKTDAEHPHLVQLEGTSRRAAWGQLLSASLPGRRVVQEKWRGVPTVVLDGQGSEHWWKSKSRNFRQQMRRSRRRLDEMGADIVLEEPPFDDAIDDLVRMHLHRWQERGGSAAIDAGVVRMLRDAGRSAQRGTFQIWSMRLDGRRIAAHLFMSSGDVVSYWLGGFEEDLGEFRPSMVLLLHALDQAHDEGKGVFDLGPGTHPYKLRITRHVEAVDWVTIVPPGMSGLLASIRLTPKRLARTASERYPEGAEWFRKTIGPPPEWLR